MLIYRLFGIGQYRRGMKNFPAKVRKKILRAVVRAGVTIIKKQFKANLRKDRRTGLMEKAVVLKVKMYKSVMIGMAGINKQTTRLVKRFGRIRPKNYNHLIEMGRRKFKRVWYNKKKKQKLKKSKWIPAAAGTYPLRNAINSTRSAVSAKMQEVFKAKVAAMNATIELGEYTV